MGKQVDKYFLPIYIISLEFYEPIFFYIFTKSKKINKNYVSALTHGALPEEWSGWEVM